jgi:HlyD family type I secretion membrane fusion protein
MTKRAPSRAAPERSPRATIVTGFACIALCFGGFGAWAAIAPLASAVIAPAAVTVDSKRKKVQHLEGGIVKELLVRDGDMVEAGQVLIRLDETRALASLSIVRAALDAARAVEARLNAEQNGADAPLFPIELMAREGEPAVGDTLRGQRLLFEARRVARFGQAEILAQRVTQLDEQIVGLKAQQVAKEKQIVLIADELGGLKQLFKDGHATKPRILALERESAKIHGERGELISEIARAKTAIGEAKLQIIQIDRTFREEVVAALREAQDKIVDLSERVASAAHVVDHIDIRAPVGGIVVGLDIHTVGGVIKPGDTLLEIVPQRDRLIVEGRIRPTDVDNVAVGLESTVNFTAFKQRTLPTIFGRVAYVSADSLTDPKTGEIYYTAKIDVDDSELAKLGDRELLPGMPAQVMIRTGERTALRYLVQPVLDSMDRAWREE